MGGNQTTTAHLATTRTKSFQPRRFNALVGLLSALVVPTAWAWPDLQVIKSGPTQAAPGELITYTLTYSNAGPVRGTSVVLKDYLPANVTAVPGTLGNGVLSGGVVTWSIGTVNSRTGGSRTFQARIATNAPSGLSITNRAQVTLYEAEETGKTANNTSILITKILSTNRPPVAVNDFYGVNEDTLLTLPAPGVLANDSDPDNDPLTVIPVGQPAHGTLTLNPNGGFTYQPATNYTGLDSFTYKANDGVLNSGIATVTLTITNLNDPPLALNDSYTLAEDTLLTLPAPGVLANDSDPDNDPLTVIPVGQPAHGTLTLNPNGGFTYQPATNYTGPDSFTYKANDGVLESSEAQVLITITPANDMPLAVDDDYSTPEDTPLTIAAPGVLINDSDPDGDSLSAVLVTAPVYGALTLNADGSFVYAPTNDYHGLDNFSYRTTDGLTNSTVATVTIQVTPVNDPPDTNDWTGKTFTVYEDRTLSISAATFLAGLRDRDGDLLRVSLVSSVLHGLLDFLLDGSFTFQPRTNFNGTDSFQFRVSDGKTNTAVLSANINVLPVNDAPSFIKGADQLVQQNAGPQVVPLWAQGISPGPTDETSQLVTFHVSHDNNSLFATPPMMDAGGTLTFTPAPNTFGSATVTVVAQDDGGIANEGVDTSAPQTFSITVNGPPTVAITSPTNGAVYFAPASFTLLADAQDPDGTVASVELFAETNQLGAAIAAAPYFVVLTNLPVGSYTYHARATDNLGATGESTPITVSVIQRPPLTTISALHYNPQTDFFETRVRITNPTYSTLDAVRVCVLNLTNIPAITVHNRSGYTNGVPYVQTHAAVPPGSYVDMIIEFYSPLRIAPHPILQPELITPATSPNAPTGTGQPINRWWMLANQTFMVEFATLSNRVYSVQYSPDLVSWKAANPAVTGTGNWVQWIDNGEPKTDGSPAAQAARYYRVVLLP